MPWPIQTSTAPLNRTGTAPKPRSDNRRSDEDDAARRRPRRGPRQRIGRARSFRSSGSGTPGCKPSWTLLFPASMRRPSRSGRPGRDRRPGRGTAASDRGQEGRPGARTGKVISVRGKCIFVDLGGKSEGILSVTDFEDGQLPEPGSSIEVVVERFDPEEGRSNPPPARGPRSMPTGPT